MDHRRRLTCPAAQDKIISCEPITGAADHSDASRLYNCSAIELCFLDHGCLK